MDQVKNSLQFILLFVCITIILSTSVIGISFLYYRKFLKKDSNATKNQVVENDTSYAHSNVLGAYYIPEQFIQNEPLVWGENAFLIGPNLETKVEFTSDLHITATNKKNVFTTHCSLGNETIDIQCLDVLFNTKASNSASSNEIHYFSLGIDGITTEYMVRGWNVEYFQDVFGYVDRQKQPITVYKSIHKDQSDEYFGCFDSVCIILKENDVDIQSILQDISINTSTESERDEFGNIVIQAFSEE